MFSQHTQTSKIFRNANSIWKQKKSFFLTLFRNPYYVDCSLAYIVAYNLGNRATTTWVRTFLIFTVYYFFPFLGNNLSEIDKCKYHN